MSFWLTATLALTAVFLAERLVDRLIDRTSKLQAIFALCGMAAGMLCYLCGIAEGYRYGLNYGDRRLAFFAALLIGGVVGLIVGKVLRV
jgi:hypothetical protein